MQLIAQVDEERKSKALIQVSLGLSVVFHLLILAVVVSESTDAVDVDDDPRTQPLIVKLQEPTHTQPSRSQTTNAKEPSLQREWYPETRSLAVPSSEVDATPREKSAVGGFNQHGVAQSEPSEARQTEAHEAVAPETNQKHTAIPDAEGTPKRDLYGLAHDFIQQEAREEALRKRRQSSLWRQAPSIMHTPPSSITDKPGEPDEPKNAFSDALKAAMKEPQEYVIILPLSKKCGLGGKRFNREQAERQARESAASGVAPGANILLGLHCKK